MLQKEEVVRLKEESIKNLKVQQKQLLGEKELVRLTLDSKHQIELELEKAKHEIASFKQVNINSAQFNQEPLYHRYYYRLISYC
jgi:hypothetical protein